MLNRRFIGCVQSYWNCAVYKLACSCKSQPHKNEGAECRLATYQIIPSFQLNIVITKKEKKKRDNDMDIDEEGEEDEEDMGSSEEEEDDEELDDSEDDEMS